MKCIESCPPFATSIQQVETTPVNLISAPRHKPNTCRKWPALRSLSISYAGAFLGFQIVFVVRSLLPLRISDEWKNMYFGFSHPAKARILGWRKDFLRLHVAITGQCRCYDGATCNLSSDSSRSSLEEKDKQKCEGMAKTLTNCNKDLMPGSRSR